jgi:DNA (cytosine-5)-methyltransferase 1
MNFIELCAGAGGLSCGLIKAGFKPILLNDINKDCCETLKLNHPNTNIICDNIENMDFTSYKNIDLLVSGIPCQSWSLAGLGKGLDDKRGQLMHTFAKIIDIIKPKIFMIENVKGLMLHNKGQSLNEILSILNHKNLYEVQYKLLNSFDYSVPQKRERVFVIGTLRSEKLEFNYPEKNKKVVLLKDVLKETDVGECAKYNDLKIKLFKQIPQGGCWINLPEELQRSYLGNSYNTGGGKRGILYRLSMDKPSLTLLCSPSQKQTERCHPLHERPLSVKEYSNIQTFPKTYKFHGSMSSKYKQIGNAVPIELARQIGICLKNCLNKSSQN